MQIARNATASVAQVLVSAIVMFILYRFVLETLGEEYLGIWSIVLATVSASRIGEMGLSASVTRFVAKYRAQGDNQSAGQIVQTAVISVIVLLTFILLVFHPLLTALFKMLFAGAALTQANALLPYVLISFVLTAAAGVFQSGLDGCLRYDWRALLMISGQLFFLLAALWLAPEYGLMGLALAQIGQGILLMIAGWALLRRIIPGLSYVPCKWRKSSFQEMLGYGLQFQLGSIAMLLFEPCTKALLGKYSGLATAGYYEMASQFVGKARALIVTANQVVVPVIASLDEQDKDGLQNMYRKNIQLLFFVVIPFYALVAASAPLLSELWIGYYEPNLVFFVNVLALVWGLNTFAGPAYFSNLGTGRVVWNTVSHVWMGVANMALGLVLGPHYGAPGIVWGMAVALISGSALIVACFHREQSLSWRLLVPMEAIGLFIAAILLVVTEYYTYHDLVDQPFVIRLILCALLPPLLLGPVLWRHPMRIMILTNLHSLQGRKIF